MHGTTLVDVLSAHASRHGNDSAYVLLDGSGNESARLSFGALHRRAIEIAARLQTLAQPGDPVLLVFPTGLDFVAALFGCMYAGTIDDDSLDRRIARNTQHPAAVVCGMSRSIASSQRLP